MTRRAVGQRIEGQVANYLRRRGLKLIARNYACRFGEIDLVMRHGDVIAFIEVRGRTSTAFLAPAQSIDARKQRRLALTAGRFLQAHPQLAGFPARFDVVAATGPNYRTAYEWIQGAFSVDDCPGL